MINIKDINLAAERIKGYAHITPILSSIRLNRMFGCNLYFKCENFQKVGAFKFRGALNAVSLLSDEERQKGVVTHSSGNHAQALSLAASIFGIPAYIVMPDNAPKVKVDAVKEYGGKITFCKPVLEARESAANKIIKDLGARFIHPYDNYNIIAGQGTCGREFIEQLDLEPDIVMAPIGGGGLLSGTAISVKTLTKNTKVFGAEPEMADDAYRSFKAGKIIPQTNPQTIADGLLTSVGERNFEILLKNLDKILLCSEKSILTATKLIFENLKIVVEPSAAVSLACVIDNSQIFHNKTVGLVLSGGNIDIKNFRWD